MPRVQCPWNTCKYNSSKYANERNGECKKEDIVLEHTEVEIDDESTSLLDCKSFVWDKKKEYK